MADRNNTQRCAPSDSRMVRLLDCPVVCTVGRIFSNNSIIPPTDRRSLRRHDSRHAVDPFDNCRLNRWPVGRQTDYGGTEPSQTAGLYRRTRQSHGREQVDGRGEDLRRADNGYDGVTGADAPTTVGWAVRACVVPRVGVEQFQRGLEKCALDCNEATCVRPDCCGSEEKARSETLPFNTTRCVCVCVWSVHRAARVWLRDPRAVIRPL